MDDAEGSDTLYWSGARGPYSQWLVVFVGAVCLSGGVGGTLQPKFARGSYKMSVTALMIGPTLCASADGRLNDLRRKMD